ncbi:MAG: hypothetical protein EXS13_15130 [Planctomycetes bacterium]|nr:hypothetical protein [Planctomycetota bacterium]
MNGLALALAYVALQGTPAPQGTEITDTLFGWPLREKTLVAWVRLADLDQRGGSVLTIQDNVERFDALVFGECSPKRWMTGSDFFRRSVPAEQQTWEVENAGPGEVVQIAARWFLHEVDLWRNGERIAHQATAEPTPAFEDDARVVMGLRHLAAAGGDSFRGAILDARIYSGVLEPEQIRALQPDTLESKGDVIVRSPFAWWRFEGDDPGDEMARLPAFELIGGARVVDGELVLPGNGAAFSAGRTMLPTRANESRPKWHLTAWPDEGVALPYDTNGCIWWKGRYHLMYIFQDARGHCWGHASSANLVDWTFHPAALAPEPGDTDHGTFSGNAFLGADGRPMLCWFGIDAGVCVATAEMPTTATPLKTGAGSGGGGDAGNEDLLIRWRKHPDNPVVPIPKPGEPGHGEYTVWDPYLWREGDDYVCLLGGNSRDGKDTLWAGRAKDLLAWEWRGAFYSQPDPSWTVAGEDCSCPDFFALGDRHVLLCISHKVGARAYVGRFDAATLRFEPERHVRMNWPGGHFFAPESLLAPDGRRIFWAWITDPRSMATQRRTGSGAQSLPRVLDVAPDGTLAITPARELEALRGEPIEFSANRLDDGIPLLLDSRRGDSLELDVAIEVGTATEVALIVRADFVSGEQTAIVWRPATETLSIDLAHSTLRKDVHYSAGPIDVYGGHVDPRTSIDAPLELAAGEPLLLRVFLDGPLIEVFANDRQCLTTQLFPQSPEALDVRLLARGGDARLLRAIAWPMRAAEFIDRRR